MIKMKKGKVFISIKMIEEKKQLINYLSKCEEEFRKEVQELEKKLRNTNKNSFYYNSYLKEIHKLNAKREFIKAILKLIGGG